MSASDMQFLRHIERCKVLVLLLDMAGTDGREPWDDYKNLLNELELYDPGLLERPRLVVANKMDEAVGGREPEEIQATHSQNARAANRGRVRRGHRQIQASIREAVEEAKVSGLS